MKEHVQNAQAHATVGINEFEEIYLSYSHFVAQCIRKVLDPRSHEQVEDLVQETFYKAYRAFLQGTILPSNAISRWLARIATNITIDTFRKQRQAVLVPFGSLRGQRTEQEDDLVDEVLWQASSHEVPFEQRLSTCESIERVFQKMPPTFSTCLLHYEHNGFTCTEIAKQLNMNEVAVRMRLMRARTCFKKLYQYEL